MLQKTQLSPEQIVQSWIDSFNTALQTGQVDLMAKLFCTDSHWRNILGLDWRFETVSGQQAVSESLIKLAKKSAATEFELHPVRVAPAMTERAGEAVIEAALRFESKAGEGIGVLRLIEDSETNAMRAWSLMTAMDRLSDSVVPKAAPVNVDAAKEARAADFKGPNWLERWQSKQRYEDRSPQALVVGGGHAGLCAAVELQQLGIDTLVIDSYERVGDNWRNRYRSLSLHNKTPANHMPYMPFPSTWPDYIPKDKIANWLEGYVEAMELNVWTETAFNGATRDEKAGCWIASVTRSDGSTQELRPEHIVMATSVSGTPKMPDIPSLDQFGGEVLHSSAYKNGAAYQGKSVAVFGTGNSAHDIAQDLHGSGAQVTMIQRSPSLVVDLEPSAQLYDGIYYGDGPPLEDRDLVNTSVPLAIIKKAHKLLTTKVKEIDAPLIEGLERAGFRLDFGEDGTGWPLKYRTRGGGYYFNVGCSELIVDGSIKLMPFANITHFDTNGFSLVDGSQQAFSAIVLATGYNTQSHLVGQLFGQDVADRVGAVWGFDEKTQELRNMWVRTPQAGLWFTGGAFSQCRIYSKYMAMQVKAEMTDLIAQA